MPDPAHPHTVFVLGAGASMPYGFPSGNDLRHEMCTATLQPGDPRHRILIQMGYNYEEIEKCRISLARSWASSIDMFLATRTELAPIGKAAIALTIGKYEIDNELFFAEEGDWFRYFWRSVHRKNSKDFPSDKFAFVTFNYDRALEHALCNGLEHAYGKKAPAKLMPKIVHVYGSLGAYPIDGAPGVGSRPYATDNTPQSTRLSQHEINVMSEKQPDSPYVRQAVTLLTNAIRIVFLGFGFDDDNCQLLRLVDKDSCVDKDCSLLGTALGITPEEASGIKERFPKNISGGLMLGLHHCDCLTLLRTHPYIFRAF
jgi:hypothetical protein